MGIFDIKPWRKRTHPGHPSGLDGPLDVGDPRPQTGVAVEHTHMAAPASTVTHDASLPPSPAPEACEKLDCEKTLHDRVLDQIRQVYDPEIPVNIYELGLIYDVLVEGTTARVQMTLTSPQCPSAQEIPVDVKYRVEQLPEITEASVEIVWEPAWEPSKMSEMAKLELGMF